MIAHEPESGSQIPESWEDKAFQLALSLAQDPIVPRWGA